MVKRIAKIVAVVMLWALILAYTIGAAVLSVRHHREKLVERVEIHVEGTTESGAPTDESRIREWLVADGVETIGAPIDSVDIRRIRRMIMRNGFIAETDIYVAHSGTLHIDIRERKPMMRLLVDGYNLYITEERFLFTAPEASTHYTPIVTGNYRPLFGPDFEGDVSLFIDSLRAASAERVKQIGKEKNTLYKREDSLRLIRRDIRDSHLKRGWFESKSDFRARSERHKAERKRNLRYYEGLLRDTGRAIDAVTARQDAERERYRRTEERHNDFLRLVEFVEWLRGDDFWSAEIVQIVAGTTSFGTIDVTLIPRSGDFKILLGELDAPQQKLDRLMSFYRNGLVHTGWNRYKTINLRYNNQVVCTE